MFSDEPTITEIRKIIKFKITGEKWLVKSRLLQKSETLLNRQSPDENFSDEPTITEIRTITDSAITRQTFFTDELTITEIRNITESTITAEKSSS